MRKRISKYKHLHSNRFRYLSSSIPLICASGLLALVGLSICPSGSLKHTVYANSSDLKSDTTDDGIALTLGSASLKKDSTTTSMNYISTPVNITAKDVESYRIVVQAASGNGNLVGLSNGEEIKGVGTNVATNAFANNTWGYKLAEGSVSEANLATLTYNPLPANGAGANTPAYTQKTDNEAANGKAFTLAFAAKFSDDTMPDHYQTDVLVSLAASPKAVVEYSITYNANGGTGTPNPASQSISSKEDTHTFTAATQGTLARTGYTFLGWAESNSATSAQYTAGSSTITLNRSMPAKVLYAVWKANPKTLTSINNMQEITTQICADSTIGENNTLTDLRDSSTYTVRKLNDGHCWMTQNLRLVGQTLTSVNSDTSVNYNLPSSSLNNFSTDVTVSGVYYANNVTYGAYYTWCAATAGSCPTTKNATASRSICPKGWRLPTKSEFETLINTANGGMASTYNFSVFAGTVQSKALTASGTEGYWWSSTAGDYNDAYHLFARKSDGIFNTNTMFRYYGNNGYSVRCMAR